MGRRITVFGLLRQIRELFGKHLLGQKQKNTFFGAIIICLFLAWGFIFFINGCSIRTSQKIQLVKDGRSDYVIVLSRIASPSEEYAALDLQKVIEEICGCKIPLVRSPEVQSGKRIFIGSSLYVDSLLADMDIAAFGDEEFVIRTVADDIVIAGGPLRGTMYGVFTFLEKYLGCRWYTAEVKKIPKAKFIALPVIDDRQKPAFEYRETYYTEAQDRYWATHNKVNSSSADLPEEVGGRIAYANGHFVHTFYQLLPPEKYFRRHPEYFSLVNGKRVGERGQLCLTNPDVLRIAIREVEKWIKENPDARIVSISQNDWEGYCECENCRQIDEQEGSHAATVVRFVNAIADALGKKYPHIYFDTLAYTYTQTPPKTLRARDNVIIRLCHMAPSCDSHPLATCPLNADYVRDLQGWRQKAKNIYVWHYVTNFHGYLIPFPNFNAIRQDIPFYQQNGVKGIFCQGNSARGGGGEFAELRSFVLAKLLWDPTIDVDAVIDDFMSGVYGRAAEPIRAYFDFLHKLAAQPDMHFDLFTDPDKLGYLTPKTLAKAHDYFGRAEALVADQPSVLARVRLAHLPVYTADLWFQGQAHMNRDADIDATTLATFKQIVEDNGIQYYREGGTIEAFLQAISTDYRFVRSWKVIGPFDCPLGRGLQTVLPPERELRFDKTYTGVAGVPVKWQVWPYPDSAYIDFVRIFEPDSFGVAYALTFIRSSQKLTTKLGVGSNDGVRVWVNDRLVHDNPILRQAAPNQDIVPVTLRKGWNKILVKVDQAGLNWGLYFNVYDPDKKLVFDCNGG